MYTYFVRFVDEGVKKEEQRMLLNDDIFVVFKLHLSLRARKNKKAGL